ncbi:choline dehydrogenase [Allopusillimonas soli]|uniref:GMC family oxidoreductase N-terminal domain-containing protein n=1 Tax=Allopusillimonas soli TaxID=659016 RepID=A0A853FG36_9BURK|nr:GMC family oxidoreductase N-terminal domain-containing protein [Allopusillimonas soli]NYT37760.1 GMC family oxidoreductase N-terminal domain-containing protein [Allopusillimonas soli]TEA74302.1 choline dehydrogenase [Allopusillimonas soli]
MSDQDYDYVIVGAGTAGCLLANRLSADPGNRVLLIEAGGNDNYHWIHIPVGYLYCIGNPRTDWLYNTMPDPGLNGRTLRYPRGKTLGGCSSINGMIYMRGQARDYDDWAAQTGDDAWTWENCMPDFKAHESHYRLDAARSNAASEKFFHAHGAAGEWRVEKQRLHWDILDAFAQAAQEAGIPATDDFNQGVNEGVGYFEVNQKNGWRWNAAKAFLRPACNGRANFTLWVNTHVVGLDFNPRADGRMTCTGVTVLKDGHRIRVRARKEVILSAGSIGTPQLLQRSGIGPADILRQHEIPIVLDRPGVGANLQDHLQIRTVFKVSGVKTLNTVVGSLWGKALVGLEYALRRTGPMSMAPSQLGAFTRSDPGRAHPNIQYHVQPLSLEAFGDPLHTFNAFTASVCNLNPTSRGSVHIQGPGHNDAPAICPNYLSTDEDRKVAADSLRVTRNIVAQPALAKYQPQEYKPGVQYQTEEELARLAGDIATTIFHPVGTAKMGKADDPMAVVDPHLRVIGVTGLRIVDASIMPTITSGNTNSPTLMIAEKAARWILSEQA